MDSKCRAERCTAACVFSEQREMQVSCPLLLLCTHTPQFPRPAQMAPGAHKPGQRNSFDFYCNKQAGACWDRDLPLKIIQRAQEYSPCSRLGCNITL